MQLRLVHSQGMTDLQVPKELGLMERVLLPEFREGLDHPAGHHIPQQGNTNSVPNL